MTTTTGNLYIISAPSGAGKTSLVHALLASVSNLAVSVSYTTRPPRPGEKDGVDYHFVDEAQFKTLIAQEALLEHAVVFAHYYGSSRLWAVDKLSAGIDVILEIDWQGARQIRAKLEAAKSIFILPPSWETLKDRLRQRGQDDDTVITKRLHQARIEISHYAEYNYLIINDHFSRALADLTAIIRVCRLQNTRQQCELAIQLLA